jgi:hypothetical protein
MIVLFLFACESTAKDGEGFQGGSFQFTTTGVDDQCNDGALDLVFMPEGTPQDFEKPIELPSVADLPQTYSIDIQDPFSNMEVTVAAGASEDQMEVLGAVQTGVELDAEAWPGCKVDSVIDIYLTITGENEVEGNAVLSTSSYDEDSCPAEESDPCDILLDLTASRI